jgi:CubicO group peptidase (beta-lactamase class C family)
MPLASHQSQQAKADLSNWRTSPSNRWAFRKIDALLPVAEIADGGDVAPLPDRRQELDQFGLATDKAGVLSLEDFLRATSTDGFVVLHHGELVYEFYDHGTTADTPHILMSASKSITGLIAGILQARGRLDSDALVSSYVPEIADTAYREATVRHLLDMRCGVVLDAGELRAYAVATNWEALAPGEQQFGLHTFFSELKAPYRSHGGPFSYVSANTDLLGWVIERATSERFAGLASELLWQPMGAEHAALMAVDCEGAPRCTGGFCTTTRDLARLGQLIVMNGSRNGVNVIPPALLADILTNGNRDAWKQGEFAASFGGREMSYRSGWYVVHDEPRMLFAMGIHGQNLFLDRASQIVIAKVSSQGTPIDYAASGLTHRAVAEIRRCLASA